MNGAFWESLAARFVAGDLDGWSAARKSPASPPPVAASGRERAIDGDHRRAAGVQGVDDLGVVDALQIDRGDPEVGVSELALDDDQRDAFAGHLDGMRVAELVRREAPTHPGLAGDAAQFRAGGAGGPRPSACGTVDDEEQRSDRQLDPGLKPWFELLPRPVVHAHLAAPADREVTRPPTAPTTARMWPTRP